MNSLHILLVGFFFQSPAFAQIIYKCGNTFSQTPCAIDAKKIEVKPAVGVDCSDYKNMFSDGCRGKSGSSVNNVEEERAKVQKQIY